MQAKDRIEELTRQVLESGAKVVLIDALPGTGRVELLRRVAADLATSGGAGASPLVAALDAGERFDPGHGPAVLVGSAAQVEEYARLRLAGRILEIGNRDLFLPAGNADGGWPLLAEALARGARRRDVVRWLREEVWPALEERRRSLLLAVCRAGALDARELPEEFREAFEWFAPLMHSRGGTIRLATAFLADALCEATAHVAASDPVSLLLEEAGDPAASICAALAAGRRRRALAALARSGGVVFGHLHGPEAAVRVLGAFGEEPDPTVVALRVETAVKAGNIERARYLLGRALGHENMELEKVLRGDAPDPLRLARFLLVSYLGEPVPFAAMAALPGLLARFPADAHLQHGLVHNVMVDVHLRAGRLGEAEAAAERALMHFGAGRAPYLVFYIRLYQALIELHRGAPGRALPPLGAAEAALAATPFETPQDWAILELARAQAEYERGEPSAMAAFAEHAFDGFAYGELWPSIAGRALAFGAEALLQLRGTGPALDYLDRWRAQQVRGRQFRLMAEQREVAILQGARRWREARQRLEAMATRIGRVWMDTAGGNLTDLRGAEDIAQAMLWVRQQAFDRPRDVALARRLEALEANPQLSWRQVQCVRLWRAWAARRQGRVPEARRRLAGVLDAAAARDCRAPVLEERVFVLPLIEDARIMQGPMREAPLPPGLRRGAATAFGAGPLSRQEWRALLLLAEGCSNKEIAREMELSLPTVKFHLKNLYAKLEADGRRAAVAEARRKGLIDV